MLFDEENLWKKYFGTAVFADTAAIRSVTPIIEQDGAFSFSHKSIQEMFVAKAVCDSLCAAMTKSGLTANKMQANLETLMQLGSEDPVFNPACTVESLTGLLRRAVESEPKMPVSQTRHIAQAILLFINEVSQSALTMLDLTEEEGVRDFIVDSIMLQSDLIQALLVAALVSDGRLAGLDSLRSNCLSICRDPNPKRQGGSLLHVAAKEGAVSVLQGVLNVLQYDSDDAMTNALCGDGARDKGRLKATPLIAAAAAGQMDAVDALCAVDEAQLEDTAFFVCPHPDAVSVFSDLPCPMALCQHLKCRQGVVQACSTRERSFPERFGFWTGREGLIVGATTSKSQSRL